jgi:hypothetical protein
MDVIGPDDKAYIEVARTASRHNFVSGAREILLVVVSLFPSIASELTEQHSGWPRLR